MLLRYAARASPTVDFRLVSPPAHLLFAMSIFVVVYVSTRLRSSEVPDLNCNKIIDFFRSHVGTELQILP